MKFYSDIKKQMKLPEGATFKNSKITNIDVECNVHYNVVYPMIEVANGSYNVQLFNSTNLTSAVGVVLRHVYFCVNGDYLNDIIRFSRLIGNPIRLILDTNLKIIGIAHFMKDDYIIFDDYLSILMEELK